MWKMQANLNPRQHSCDNLTLDTKFIKPTLLFSQGYAVARWLRHCATSRKVSSSIPDGVSGIFY